MANLITAVGALFHLRESDGVRSFLGSCFAFGGTTKVVTAAHCVGRLEADEIVSVWPPNIARSATSVVRHPSADIAVVTFPALSCSVDPFTSVTKCEALGADFYAIGFTEAVTGAAPARPTARLYKGYFQRFFEHRSFFGYTYSAGELSIPAPGGLSGGPIFFPSAQETVIGVVTENVRSALVLDSVEEILEDGREYKATNQAIVTFGVCLMIGSVHDWITRVIENYE